MRVKVQRITGQENEYVLNQNNSFGMLKEIYAMDQHIPINQIRFYYNSIELEDDIILNDFTLDENKFIKAVLKLRGGGQIFVKFLNGKTQTFDVEFEHKVRELKNEIFYKFGIPPEQQRLVFAGKELDNNLQLNDYGLQKESTVHLLQRLNGGNAQYFQ